MSVLLWFWAIKAGKFAVDMEYLGYSVDHAGQRISWWCSLRFARRVDNTSPDMCGYSYRSCLSRLLATKGLLYLSLLIAGGMNYMKYASGDGLDVFY